MSVAKIKTAAPEPYESRIWTAGEDNLETYYVYGLVRAENKILAFAEGRIGRRDKDAHHIVLKISDNYGATWSANRFVARSEAGETFNNPTPVVNQKTGEIFLFYARNYDNEATDLFVTKSANAGETWSEAKKLTELFADNPWRWTLHLPGPGHGLQTRNGRLIVPIWHRRSLQFQADERNYGVSIIYSDNGGRRWKTGGTVPLGDAQLNESRIIELANGDLLLNARSGAFVTSPRYSSRSCDGGLNWSDSQKIEALPPAFATDSSFINLPTAAVETLIFVRPHATDTRKNLTVYSSTDAGKSWKIGKTIYAGVAGYSDAIVLECGDVGVIYGRDTLDENGDVEGNVRETVFARFGLDWLLN